MKNTVSVDNDAIIESSGNVFADLGLPDAEELLVKANLVHAVTEELKRRDITQSATAKLTGLDQADISRLSNGKFDIFSRERLLDVLKRLGIDIEIVIKRGRSAVGTIRVRELV